MYLGIDGGGTHTRVELRDEENRFLRHFAFGPFNMAAIGEEAFRLRLREIFADIGAINRVQAICIGGAGSSGSAMEAVLRDELEAAGFAGRLKLCGDHEIALAGALDEPGCILIAGTGSICYGTDGAGHFARCGGWGHLLDDCGSAYALGREALSAVLRTEDGRLPENQLHRAVMEHLGAADARDIVRYTYYENRGKADIAALAPLVLQCAGEDEVSRGILRTQAQELIQMVSAVRNMLSMERPKLVLLGGLLEKENVYSRMVRIMLEDLTQIVPPAHDALWGAAELAHRLEKEEYHAE